MKCATHQIPFCSICQRRKSIGAPGAFLEAVKKQQTQLTLSQPSRPRAKTLDHIPMTSESSARWEAIKILGDLARLPKCFVPEQARKDGARQIKYARTHMQTIIEARKEMAGGDLRAGGVLISRLLRSMYQESIELLGPPPSPYCILSAGSFARDEMMPFSDCDLCIMYDPKKEGARQYTSDLLGLLIFKGKLVVFLMNPGCHEIPEGFSVDMEFEGAPEKVAMQCVLTKLTLCDAALLVHDEELFDRFNKALTETLAEELGVTFEVANEVCQMTSPQSLQRIKTSAKVDLKNDLYRPLQKFTSLLAMLFDEQLRFQKNSIQRLDTLRERECLDPDFAQSIISALDFVMAIRLDRHTQQKKADDAMPRQSIDVKKFALVLEALGEIHARLLEYRKTRSDKAFRPKPKSKGFFSFFK